MYKKFGYVILMLLSLLALRAAELPPMEAFFSRAEMSGVRFSPDGKRLLFLTPVNGLQSIAVYDIASGKGQLVFVPKDYSVLVADWKGDRILLGGDAGGNESFALRSIKADGSDVRDLNESIKDERFVSGAVFGFLQNNLPDDPAHVMIEGLGVARDGSGNLVPSGSPGVYRMNVRTGERSLVYPTHHSVIGVVTDDKGDVRVELTQSGGKRTISVCAPGSKKMVEVAAFPEDEVAWEFVGLSKDGASAYVTVHDEEHDRPALYRFSGQNYSQRQLLFNPPAGEVTGLVYDGKREVVGISWEDEKPHTEWLDAGWAKMYADLTTTFKGEIIRFVDSTPDNNLHVVFVHSDRNPGFFVLYDSAKPSLKLLGRRMSKLDPAQMPARQPISYTTRDGLTVHGYLTEPPGREGKTNPLILNPHGGPFGIRDDWAFDPEVAYLATRGYSVLQVNYRGSGGYGWNFRRAGARQWGLKMQDDLTDAVKWAIASGKTKADQVGIYGASYGGYATLAGLVYTPELYRFGVNYVGVSDLRLIAKDWRNEGRGLRVFSQNWIGTDADYLRDRSPVEHVDKIRVPLFNAYGKNDPRVKIAHWERLESALKKAGVKYDAIVEKDEGHGFRSSDKANRGFYSAFTAFLADAMPTDLNPRRTQVTIGDTSVKEMPAK